MNHLLTSFGASYEQKAYLVAAEREANNLLGSTCENKMSELFNKEKY